MHRQMPLLSKLISISFITVIINFLLKLHRQRVVLQQKQKLNDR